MLELELASWCRHRAGSMRLTVAMRGCSYASEWVTRRVSGTRRMSGMWGECQKRLLGARDDAQVTSSKGQSRRI